MRNAHADDGGERCSRPTVLVERQGARKQHVAHRCGDPVTIRGQEFGGQERVSFTPQIDRFDLVAVSRRPPDSGYQRSYIVAVKAVQA